MSVTSKPVRGGSIISNTVAPPSTPAAPLTQSQQKRQQKKASDERVTLFAHLQLYTRHLERVPSTM